MRLTRFDGGLSLKLASHLIEQNEARVCVNVDTDKGILTPVKSADFSDDLTANAYAYYYAQTDTWYSETTPHDWLDFQGRLYESDRVNRPIYYFEGEEYPLGMIGPDEEAPEITIEAIGDSPTELDIPSKEISSFQIFESGPLFDGDVDSPFALPTPERTYTYMIVRVRVVNGQTFRILSETKDVYLPGIFATASQASVMPGVDEGDQISWVDVDFSVQSEDLDDKFELYRQFVDEWVLVDSREPTQTGPNPLRDRKGDIDSFPRLSEEDTDTRLTGTFEYVITFENTDTGAESSPYNIGSIELEQQAADISGSITILDEGVDQVNLYRIGGNITQFTRVTSLAHTTGTGGDPTLFTLDYTDELKDSELDGRLLSTANYARPHRLKYLIEAYAVLFAVVDYTDSGYENPNRLHFTPVGEPENWPVLNFISLPLNITGNVAVANGVISFTDFKSYLITGYEPANLNRLLLSGSQGCISHDSIATMNGAAIWPSKNGICISDGGEMRLITEEKFGLITFEPVNAVLHDNNYYLHLVNGTTFVADLISGKFYHYSLGIESVVLGAAQLFGTFPIDGQAEHDLGELFKGDEDLELEYRTPIYIGESYVLSKVYNHVYISSYGDLEVEIFINEASIGSYTLTGNLQTHEINIPHNQTIGMNLQVEVTGTGTINEIFVKEGSPHK